MDWLSKKSWAKEDELYSPKRKVNNKGSRSFHHVIGSLPSRKMGRHIPYESLWGECLFYYLLELDPMTVRYYFQPVSVQYQVLTSKYVLSKKQHVPDTLAFRQGFIPHLYQVKGGDTFIEQTPHLYQACINHCRESGWNYSVVRPKFLPDAIKWNIQYIMHYMHPRPYYDTYISEILNKIGYYTNPTVEYIAKSFIAKADFRDILPIIYHLIFLGRIRTNLLRPISQDSELSLGDLSEDLLPYFKLESVFL